MLSGLALFPKKCVGSLGVRLHLGLLLDDQGVVVWRSTYYQPYLFLQLHPFLGKKDLALVTQTLVTFWLDYCRARHVGLPVMSRKFQLVAACLLTGTTHFHHVTPLLKGLHWLSTALHVQFKLHIFAKPLGVDGEGLRCVPALAEVWHWLAVPCEQAFSIVVPCLWNALSR